MALNKPERQEKELAVHLARHESGLMALWGLLDMDQAELNRKWIDKSGDELLQMQGEARAVRRILKTLKEGPTIKDVLMKPRGE